MIYINDTPGKGEVGVDMKSIPTAAIERVEVLRDGASAQYGSDAIAGVINVIMKEKVEYTEVNVTAGQTAGGHKNAGDGFNMGANINHGMNIGDKGSLNITASYHDQEETRRAGEPGGDGLFGFCMLLELYQFRQLEAGKRVPELLLQGRKFNPETQIGKRQILI